METLAGAGAAVSLLAALTSFIAAALAAWRERRRYERADDAGLEFHALRLKVRGPGRLERAWSRIEEWGRENPVSLSLISGVFFLIVAVLLSKL